MAQSIEERRARQRAYYEANKDKWKTPERKEQARLWREAHREKQREYARQHHARNRDERNAAHKAWNKANPEKVRANARRRHGVINPPGEARHGECPICLRTLELVCDHWHHGPKKGQVRGWLLPRMQSIAGLRFRCARESRPCEGLLACRPA